MITKRIIPCLDVKDGTVVKGVNFEGLRQVASPVELARYYAGYGLYLDSPDPRLDQTQTFEAIEQLQLYLEYLLL